MYQRAKYTTAITDKRPRTDPRAIWGSTPENRNMRKDIENHVLSDKDNVPQSVCWIFIVRICNFKRYVFWVSSFHYRLGEFLNTWETSWDICLTIFFASYILFVLNDRVVQDGFFRTWKIFHFGSSFPAQNIALTEMLQSSKILTFWKVYSVLVWNSNEKARRKGWWTSSLDNYRIFTIWRSQMIFSHPGNVMWPYVRPIFQLDQEGICLRFRFIPSHFNVVIISHFADWLGIETPNFGYH